MAKLTDICSPKQWKTIGTSELSEVGYPVYGANGIIGYYTEFNHEYSTLLITCRGATCGEINISVPKSYINGNAMCLDNLSEEYDLQFLYHYLKWFNFDTVITGSAQPQITISGLSKVNVPDLSVIQQRKIAATLDKVTYLIDLCNAILEKLDLLVKSRFVEMFGDIIRNTKQWDTQVFDEITSSRLGKMLDAKKQTGTSSYPYLANFNVQWFRFELDNLNSMDFDDKDQKEFELEDGDLLVCEGGEIGRCAIWHNDIQPCFFQKALHRVRCDKGVILPVYLAWWFKYNCEHNGFSEIEGAKATIAHLPGAKLKKLNVTVPPLILQQQFAAFVEQTDKSKLAVKQVLEKAETLKKALMQEYFG